MEGFDRGTARRLDQKQAADHGLAVVGDKRAGHHDGHAEALGIGKKRLVRLVVREPRRQRPGAVDGVLAANDAMAVGAIEALEGANRKAQVIGINGTKEAVDAIKSGKLLASGDYNGFLQGCVGTIIAIRSLRKEPVIPEIVLKPTVITKANYQPYETPVESRACPSWDEAAKLGGK